jgi:5-formyltetrahydrofolate cyclo-ligase
VTLEPDKASLRGWARRTRATLPNSSSEICAHLETLIRDLKVRVVLGYRAVHAEPSLEPLVRALPDVEFLTTRANAGGILTLHPYDSATVSNRFSMLEPPLDASPLEPDVVQLALVPGLLFTKRGSRLGYGGGFYDRLLPRLHCPLVGVTRDALIVDALPLEAWDVAMTHLASESGVLEIH